VSFFRHPCRRNYGESSPYYRSPASGQWAKGSDWGDELDGSDDVPSVIFENETETGEDDETVNEL
jgi:hypothetical protein